MKLFTQMTDEEFLQSLFNEIENLSPEMLLSIHGVTIRDTPSTVVLIKEVLTEQLEDAVVSQWEAQQKFSSSNTD